MIIFCLCKVLVLLLLQFSSSFLHGYKIAAEAPAITSMPKLVRAGFSYSFLLLPRKQKNYTDLTLNRTCHMVACSSKRALKSECLAGHLPPGTNQGPTFREREQTPGLVISVYHRLGGLWTFFFMPAEHRLGSQRGGRIWGIKQKANFFLSCLPPRYCFSWVQPHTNDPSPLLRNNRHWEKQKRPRVLEKEEEWWEILWTCSCGRYGTAPSRAPFQSLLHRRCTSVMSDSVRPHRRQPTRLPRPWDSPARTLEWVAIAFSNTWKWKGKVKSLSRARLLATPWTAAHQAPPSMGFSRQEYWSGVPLPSPS